MNTDYPKRDVERPKRTKRELRAMMHLEARSHANTCDEYAGNLATIMGVESPVAAVLRKAAKFIRELAK